MDELSRDETEKEERKRGFVKKKWSLKKEFGDLEKVKNSFNRIYSLLYFDVIVQWLMGYNNRRVLKLNMNQNEKRKN